jgi:hypothetical protein
MSRQTIATGTMDKLSCTIATRGTAVCAKCGKTWTVNLGPDFGRVLASHPVISFGDVLITTICEKCRLGLTPFRLELATGNKQPATESK